MASSLRRVSAVTLTALAVLAALVLTGPLRADAAELGTISGRVTDAKTGKGLSDIRVEIFTSDWRYLGAKKANKRGTYLFTSRPVGRYHLKFVDTRPAYDTSAHVSKDVSVSVLGSRLNAVKNVTLRRGASITGTVKKKKGRASGAKLIAVNQYGGTYEVVANSKGQFAIGGLAAGKYSVFAYDKARAYTGPSTYAGNLKLGRSSNILIKLTTRAGSYDGHLIVGGKIATQTVWVTAVNKKTGQFWVQKIKRGDLSALKGLAPGKYKLIVPGFQSHLGRTVSLPKIKSGTVTDALVTLDKQGGFLTGHVVDKGVPLRGVSVSVYDTAGALREKVVTNPAGWWSLGGSIETNTKLTLVVEADGPLKGVSYGKLTLPGYVMKPGLRDVGTLTLPRA